MRSQSKQGSTAPAEVLRLPLSICRASCYAAKRLRQIWSPHVLLQQCLVVSNAHWGRRALTQQAWFGAGQLWPRVNKAVSTMGRQQLDPLMKESKPSWISSVQLDRQATRYDVSAFPFARGTHCTQ